MVGKSKESPNSWIFHHCYLTCCKKQNLTPLSYVIPTDNGKVLNFCVDRIKYVEWPPILNALCCDMSLHSVTIRSRNQLKTVLEHINCERLAKTVTKRCVIFTNFMLSNLMETIAQLLSNNTLLTYLMLEGLPLKIPYLNPLSEALLASNCLQHLHLPRCQIGDAGCFSICKAVRSMPQIMTLDLSGCDLTPLGAEYIADLIKYQKIHRYSENWIHTLRYRIPELDNMGGLRRITLCGNPQLGDEGVAKLLNVLADDLWIKALDVQNCGLSEDTVATALQFMGPNTTLVVLDLRNNAHICKESLAKVRAGLKSRERGMVSEFTWLSSVGSETSSERNFKPTVIKSSIITKERAPSSVRNNNTTVKKDKSYIGVLEEQLQEEISHRRQVEELNLQLVEQMKSLKQQQMKLWGSGSESSVVASLPGDLSNYSRSTSSMTSVSIDQTTLSYIQQAFKDIYTFIRANQCPGKCLHEPQADENDCHQEPVSKIEEPCDRVEELAMDAEMTSYSAEMKSYSTEMHVTRVPKKAQSAHYKIQNGEKPKKTTKSAHLLGDGDNQPRNKQQTKPVIFERHMGDSKSSHEDELLAIENVVVAQKKAKLNVIYSSTSPCSSISSDTLCSPVVTQRAVPKTINPRDAFYSSSESDDESTP